MHIDIIFPFTWRYLRGRLSSSSRVSNSLTRDVFPPLPIDRGFPSHSEVFRRRWCFVVVGCIAATFLFARVDSRDRRGKRPSFPRESSLLECPFFFFDHHIHGEVEIEFHAAGKRKGKVLVISRSVRARVIIKTVKIYVILFFFFFYTRQFYIGRVSLRKCSFGRNTTVR